MSDELKVGERVVADVGDHVREIGGPRFRHGTVILSPSQSSTGVAHVGLASGPVVRLSPDKIKRSRGGLIALEAIPAGSFVEVDPETGHVRRFRS